MAITAFCRKCGKEMRPGAVCPVCGGKLSASHTLWRISRWPALSWTCWNSPLRLALPALLLVGLVLLGAELTAGPGGLQRFLDGSMPSLLAWMLAGLVLAVGIALLLQGQETLEIAADKSGVTLRVLLPRPTTLRLLAHFRSPRLLRDESLRMEYGLQVDERRVAWKDVRRVQLWPEKGMFLLYGPRWWLRMAVPCDEKGWREMSALVTEKLGHKKGARVPASLRSSSGGTRSGKKAKSPAPVHGGYQEDFMADIARMNAEMDGDGGGL